MNRVVTHKFLREDQRHLFPSDINSWLFKNRQMAKPFGDLIGYSFLDAMIRKSITQLKKKNPNLIIGETHCHSDHSDGLHPVKSILKRAACLGLDYVVITDHHLPGKYMTQSIISSLQNQTQCINEWDIPNNPIKIYPAFEVSALEGHLIVILDPEYFSHKNLSDISLQFLKFDYKFSSMLDWIPLLAPFGGISIVAHPNEKRSYPFGASISWVKENLTGLVDGIEDISAGHGYQENYSNDLDLASIGSSDDHFNLLMGTVVTAYDGNIYDSLIAAVKSKKTQAISINNSLQPLFKLARKIF